MAEHKTVNKDEAGGNRDDAMNLHFLHFHYSLLLPFGWSGSSDPNPFSKRYSPGSGKHQNKLKEDKSISATNSQQMPIPQ
jgi:hypothetical protein